MKFKNEMWIRKCVCTHAKYLDFDMCIVAL